MEGNRAELRGGLHPFPPPGLVSDPANERKRGRGTGRSAGDLSENLEGPPRFPGRREVKHVDFPDCMELPETPETAKRENAVFFVDG